MKLQLLKNKKEFNEWLEIASHSLFPVNEKLENIYVKPEFKEEMLYNFDYTLTLNEDFKISFGPSILLALKNDNGDMVGTVCVRKDKHKSEACQINNIAINPDYRKQGYGKMLIDKVSELVLSRSNFKFITLTTDSARDFYKHIGMNLAGILDFVDKKRYYFYRKIR